MNIKRLTISKGAISAIKFLLWSGAAAGMQVIIGGLGSLHQNEIITLVIASLLKGVATIIQTQANANKE